ncbi:polymorphic toxin-type HINT domain-containing protein [Nonomuraea sp. NPDC049400]|uniref:polymorphic toxin-type HINT domain-containing protein n=1 Tax=Nonomuraea sp. NPDC049400 TaxID=3364352 RepID=UPI0037B93BA5
MVAAILMSLLPGLLMLQSLPATADTAALAASAVFQGPVETPKQAFGSTKALPTLTSSEATRTHAAAGTPKQDVEVPKTALPREERDGVTRVVRAASKPVSSASAFMAQLAAEPPCGSYERWSFGDYVPAGTYVSYSGQVWKAVQNISASNNTTPPNTNRTDWLLVGPCPKPPAPTITSMSPDNGLQLMTTTPTLSATATTWAGGTISFDFEVCDTPSMYGCRTYEDCCWTSSGSRTVPDGVLSWGRQYWWRLKVMDASTIGGQSQYSETRTFVVGVRQPAITSQLSTSGGSGQEFHQLVGNYTTRFTDAQVSTVGPPLSVVRSYNSMDPRRTGIFGAGWSTRWDMRIVPEQIRGRESLLVTYPDGRQVRFAKKGDGSYQPPPGLNATLAEASKSPTCPAGTTCTGWALMDKTSTSYVFDESGRLTKIVDGRGRAQTLIHGQDGKLSQVTAPGGRSLTFSWTGAHVTSVSTAPVDGKSLTWTYSYNGDVLEKVCNPKQGCTQYDHASGSLYRTTVLDSDPMGYWRLGESSGTEAKDLGWNNDSIYNGGTFGKPGALAGTSDTAVELDADDSVSLPSDLLARVGKWASFETWFKTTGTGPLLQLQYKWYATKHSMLQIAADGKLSAAYLPTTTPITSAVAVNDGAWHHVLLTVAGDTQTLYLDGQAAGTLTATINNPEDWPYAWVGGLATSVDEVAVYDRPLSAAETATHFAARAAAPNKLTKVTLPSGRVWAANAYDAASDRLTTHTDQHGGAWKIGKPVYDRTTGMSTVTVTDPQDGSPLQYVYDAWRGYRITSFTDQLGKKTTYSYDTGGFLQSITDPNLNTVTTYNDARGNMIERRTRRTTNSEIVRSEYYLNAANPFDPRNDRLIKVRDARSASATDNTYATVFEYNSYGEQTKQITPATLDFPNGRSSTIAYTDGSEPAVGGGTTPAGLVKTRTDAKSNVTTFGYSAAGDLAEQTDPSGLVTKVEHDVLGRVTAQMQISDAEPGGVKTTFAYDDFGRLATQTAPGVKNEISGVTHTAKTSYTYDPDGNTLTETVTDLTGGDPERTTTYTYDAYGHQETSTDPEGGVVRTSWDKLGLQTALTDELGSVFGYAYTKRGELASRTLKNWTGSPVNPQPAKEIVLESFSYDDGGRLAARVDAMGRKTSYRYFNDGLLSQVIGDDVKLNGSTTSKDVGLEVNTYDPAGNLTQQVIGVDITTGVGITTTDYVYDAAGRLTSATLDPNKLKRKTAYEYDANDLTTKETRTAAGTTRQEIVTYAYNAAGIRTRQTVENGDQDLTTTWAVDDRGLITATTDPRGNADGANAVDYTTTNRYDARGRLTEIKTPSVQIDKAGTAEEGRPTSRIGYNTAGWQTHVIDPEGRLATSGFDKVGRRTSLTAMPYTPPGGSAVTPKMGYDYDPAGRLIKSTDPRGQVTTTEYDALGNPVRVTDPPAAQGQPAGQWISEYALAGEQLAAIDPTGARTEGTYDDLGRRITSTVIERRPASAAYTTTFEYNAVGDVTKVTPPNNKATSYTVNAAGEVTAVTDPTNNTIAYDYDLVGRPAKVTNPLGNAMVGDYDLAGRLTSVKSLDGTGATVRTVGLGYDAAGNPTRYTSGEGHVTRRSYDATDLLTELVEPVSDTKSINTSFGYDATGARTRITDGRGNATWTSYNTLGLIETLTEPATTAHPNLADRTWTHVYDVAGNETALIQPGGVRLDRQYDNLNRVTKISGSGAGIVAGDKTYGYDLADRPTSVGDQTLEYNDRSLLTKLTSPSGTSSFAYDALGNPTQRIDLTGTTTYTWDDDNRLKTVTDPVSGRTNTYDYDKADRLATITSTNPANTYDAVDRPLAQTLKNSTGGQFAKITYGWDKDDNLTSKTTEGLAGAGSNTYGYDHAGRLTSWKGPDGTTTAYEWDDAGNRTKAGDKTYIYDERNRLISGDGSTYTYTPRGTLASQTKNGNTRYLTFDAFDRLINDGDATYTYDAFDRMLTRQKSGSNQQRFVYAGLDNDIIAITDQAGAVQASYGRGPFGDLVSVKEGANPAAGALTDIHQDLVGTFTGTALSSTTTYNPFGEVAAQNGTKPALGYQSEYTDPDTGNVNMHARWYQPSTGGFASRDTWTLTPVPSIQANRYTYASGDPVTGLDPSGHQDVIHCGCGGGGGPGGGRGGGGAPVLPISGRTHINGTPVKKLNTGARPNGRNGNTTTTTPKSNTKAGKRPRTGSPSTASGPRYGAPNQSPYADDRRVSTQPRYPEPSKQSHKDPKKRRGNPQGQPHGNPTCTRNCYTRPSTSPPPPAPKPPKPPKPKPVTGGVSASASFKIESRCPLAPGAPCARRDRIELGDTAVTSVGDHGVSTADPNAPDTVPSVIHCEDDERLAGLCVDGVARVIPDGSTDVPVEYGDPPPPTNYSCDPPNSFVSGTRVLMADGSTKAIEDIKIGDRVIAVDPETGLTMAEPVTALITGEGTKRLVKITVDIDGNRGTTTDTITATDNHPFWAPALRKWLDAGQLQPGMWLQTSAGTYVQTVAVQAWTASTRVHNLTVGELHTYHVVAGDQAILVHNDGGDDDYLYRGIPEGHWFYKNALRGIAPPLGGHRDPARHNGGNTRSIFTSWTTDLDGVARDAADEMGPPGIVMRIRKSAVSPNRIFDSPDIYDESEVLIAGTQTGAEVSIGGGPWRRPSC